MTQEIHKNTLKENLFKREILIPRFLEIKTASDLFRWSFSIMELFSECRNALSTEILAKISSAHLIVER